MRNAVVTGAEGFIGSHLVSDLRRNGIHVTSLGRLPGFEAPYIAMGDAPWCPARLARIFDAVQPDTVFHLVGGAAGSPSELHQLNVGVTISVMQALLHVGIRPLLVCCGSAAEYGKAIVDGEPVCETATCVPVSAYGQAKFAQTQSVLAFAARTGTPVLIARIFNPIGPGMPAYLALGDFARQIAMLQSPQGVLESGNINVRRDFIDVDHAASTLRRLSGNQNARGIVNVCSGTAIELARLVEMLIAVSGKNVTVKTSVQRLRSGEPDEVVGSTALLRKLGAMPPPTDYAQVIARIWQSAEARWTGMP